jgi:hypothetical protein
MVVLKRKIKRQPINDAALGKERRRISPNLNLAAVRVLSWHFNDLQGMSRARGKLAI